MKVTVSLDEVRKFLDKNEKLDKLKIDYLRPDALRVTYYLGLELEIVRVAPRSITLTYHTPLFKRFLLSRVYAFLNSRVDMDMIRWNKEERLIEVLLDRIEEIKKLFLYAELRSLHIANEQVVAEIKLI